MLPYLSKYKKSTYEQLKQNGQSQVLPYTHSHSGYLPPQNQLDKYQQDLNQLGRRKAQEKVLQLALTKASTSKVNHRQRQRNLREEIAYLKQRLQKRQREQSIQQRILNRMERMILPLIQQTRIPQKSYYDKPSMRQTKYSRYKKHRSLHNSVMSIDKSFPANKFQSSFQIKAQREKSKKQIKKYLLSKFRVAAYVVYFTIYFPKYANNFTAIRLEHFKKKYFTKSLHKIVNERISFPVVSKALGFASLNQLLFSKLKTNRLTGKNLSPTDSISNKLFDQYQPRSINSQFKLKNDVLDMDIVRYLIENIVDKVNQQVKAGTFKALYDFFGDTCINHCFVMDYVLIRPQILAMKFHPSKGYVILDKKLEQIFVIQAFLNKIIVFHMLVYYQISLAQSNNQIKSDLSHKMVQDIQMHIGVCILITILVVNKAVENKLQSVKKGNYYEIPITLRPKLLHEILKLIENNEFIQSNRKYQLLQLIYGYETGLKQVQNSISQFYLFIRDKMQIIIQQISSVLITESKKHKKKQYGIYKQEVLRMKVLKKYDQSIFRIRSQNNVTTKKIQKSKKIIQETQKKVQKQAPRSFTSIEDHLGESRKSKKEKYKYINFGKAAKQPEKQSPLPVVFENLEKNLPQSKEILPLEQQLINEEKQKKSKQKKQKKKKDKKQNDQPEQHEQPATNQPVQQKKKKKKTKILEDSIAHPLDETAQKKPQTSKMKRKKEKQPEQNEKEQKQQTNRTKKDKKNKKEDQKLPQEQKEKKNKKKQQQKEKENQDPENEEKKQKKEKKEETNDKENQKQNEEKKEKKKKKKDKEKR